MSDDLYELGTENQESIKENKYNSYASSKYHISIDDFYRIMVKDWRKSKNTSYEIYLQQGNIPAGVLYNLLALEPFAKPTDEDKERLEKIKDELQKDADKFLRVDIDKRDALVQAIGFLFAIILNDRRNEDFCEILKKSTWARLSTVIADKCSDGIVELYEMSDIYKMAKDLGLFTPVLKEETINEINKLISDSNSKTESLSQAFNKFYKWHLEQNENNNLDNESNRKKLLDKFIELKKIENSIIEEKDLTDKEYSSLFDEFLEECDIKLVAPYDKFEKTFFTNFKSSHDLTKPLSSMDYAELKNNFTSLGLTEEQWAKFEKDNNIHIEKTISEVEYQKLRAAKEKIEKEAKKNKKIGKRNPNKFIILGALLVVIIVSIIGIGNVSQVYKEAVSWAEYGDSKSEVYYNLVELDGYGRFNSWLATCFLKYDWNANAVEGSQYYAENGYSKQDSYQMLIDDDLFTTDQAKYGVDNVDYDWNDNAILTLQYLIENNYAPDSYAEELKESNFTEEEIKFAFDNLEITDLDINEFLSSEKTDYSAESTATKKAKFWAEENYSKAEVLDTLIDFEKFDKKESENAVNNLQWDWNANALYQAEVWAEEKYSKIDVRKTLADYNKFEENEIDYAMNNLDWDWNANALYQAEFWAEEGYSKKHVKETLSDYNKFEESEIEYAMDNLDWDWNANAVKACKKWKEMGYSKDNTKDTLLNYEGFTESEVKYAIKKY